ncbi:hypothetical protein QE370_003276 [Aeromicrobium sp. SORGH_AS981]|nr:hypothetical protein [Aeromicrobium sp. SORGH_AS_0981]
MTLQPEQSVAVFFIASAVYLVAEKAANDLIAQHG